MPNNTSNKQHYGLNQKLHHGLTPSIGKRVSSNRKANRVKFRIKEQKKLIIISIERGVILYNETYGQFYIEDKIENNIYIPNNLSSPDYDTLKIKGKLISCKLEQVENNVVKIIEMRSSPPIINIKNMDNIPEEYKPYVKRAQQKWESTIIQVPNDLPINMEINFIQYLTEPNDGKLGGATLEKVYDLTESTTESSIINVSASNGKQIGKIIPAEGKLDLAIQYLSQIQQTHYSDGTDGLDAVILHEMGHILGILIIPYFTKGPNGNYVIPIDIYSDQSTKDNYGYYQIDVTQPYGGSKAVEMYNEIFNSMSSHSNSPFSLIPVENNGGLGTAVWHVEEGAEYGVSYNNRTINGQFYPGLDKEVMTGWLDGFLKTNNYNLPLSKITVGFLDDIGFKVNYNKADPFYST